MAKKYEDFFRSEADGLEISVLCICPEEKPYRAIVQLVHGMCEHKEYTSFIDFRYICKFYHIYCRIRLTPFYYYIYIYSILLYSIFLESDFTPRIL